MDKRIKNILRCYAVGMGIKETASTFHTSRNTVRKYVRLFLSSGKSIEHPYPMGSWMNCSAVRSPGIGNLLPEGSNWMPCFPDMYPACHAKA